MSPWIGRILFVGLTSVAVWLVTTDPQSQLRSQTISPVGQESGNLQMISSMLPTGVQQLVVMDVPKRTMAVYHVDPAQGKIQLKSVRALSWDLRMEHFNGQPPLPSELQQVQP